MFWFLLWAVSVIVCTVVAGNKGRSAGGWFLLSLFLGPLALLAIAFMPSIDQIQQGRAAAGASDTDYRKCPFCAEVVLREAIKCKHCRSDLPAFVAPVIPDNSAPVQHLEWSAGGNLFEKGAAVESEANSTLLWGLFLGCCLLGVLLLVSQCTKVEATKLAETTPSKSEDSLPACMDRGIEYYRVLGFVDQKDGRPVGNIVFDKCAESLTAY